MARINVKENKFWGTVFGAAAGAVASPVALVNGAMEAASGGTFRDGFDNVMDPAVEKLEQVGNDHSDAITGTVLTTAASAIAGRALGGRR
jgi:hypothetical protein